MRTIRILIWFSIYYSLMNCNEIAIGQLTYLFHLIVSQGFTYLVFSAFFWLTWRAQRSQNYLPFWSIGFLVGSFGWLINLIPTETFPSERLFWLVDISITLLSVSLIIYGFLIRSFQSFNAKWFLVAAFVALHWVAYFSSVRIDYGLKMAISPLYVAACMQLIVGIMWFKDRRFSNLEMAAALVCQTSVVVHAARAYLYAKHGNGGELIMLSAFDIVSFILLPIVYTATGMALLALALNDKDTSHAALIDRKSGTLNAQGMHDISHSLMWQGERSQQWVSVVICKINHLNSIARQYGYNIADQTLQEFAKTLSNEVGKKGYVGRLGNNEFVILLALVNQIEAATWAAKLRLMASQLKVIHRREPVPVTVSVGVASSRHDYDYISLLTQAQKALRESQ